MKSVPLPAIDHRSHYRTCVTQTRNRQDRTLLLDMTDRVVAAGAAYRTAARSGRLHTIQRMQTSDDERALISEVYDRRMVAATGSGRDKYDLIRESLRICPFCNHQAVYEVDHFLPQARFPELNVLPINLVPICHPCNNIKLEQVPQSRRAAFVHPYFDVLPQNFQWLFGELKRSSDGGPVLTYRVELDEEEHGDLAHRLTYHFRELELDRRFKEASARIVVELQDEIEVHLGALDEVQMADHFQEKAERSLRLHGNILETAAYFAAAENEEYCSGAYRN